MLDWSLMRLLWAKKNIHWKLISQISLLFKIVCKVYHVFGYYNNWTSKTCKLIHYFWSWLQFQAYAVKLPLFNFIYNMWFLSVWFLSLTSKTSSQFHFLGALHCVICKDLWINQNLVNHLRKKVFWKTFLIIQ